MNKSMRKYVWLVPVTLAVGGLLLQQNCAKLVATDAVQYVQVLEVEDEQFNANMINVKDGVELQVNYPTLGDQRVVVGGPVAGYEVSVTGSARAVPAVTPLQERSISYSINLYPSTGTPNPDINLPSCAGKVMTVQNQFVFRCSYSLDLLRRKFSGALYVSGWVDIVTYPVGAEGDQARRILSTAVVRIPLGDELILGDTNNNRYIDPSETGIANQGYRCALFVNGAPIRLYPWNFDSVNSVNYTTSGGELAYRCFEKSCVPEGEYQSTSPEYPCCAGLFQNSSRRCMRVVGTGVVGDTNSNSLIDGEELGSFVQSKLSGFACGPGTLPRFRTNMRVYPTSPAEFYNISAIDLGYKCVPGVRLKNLSEGEIYGEGPNYDLGQSMVSQYASAMLQMESLYHGCGNGLAPSVRNAGMGSKLHYVCEKTSASSIVGDRNSNGKIDVFYKNLFAPEEFNPEIGMISQGANCGNDSTGRQGASWPYNYTTSFSMRTSTGLPGYFCRPAAENCIPDGGYFLALAGSGFTCCAGLTLQNNYNCVASRLERLRSLTGGTNTLYGFDQWAYYYRPLNGAATVPDFLVLFPGVSSDARATRTYKADLFVDCIENNQCSTLRSMYGVTTAPPTTTTTVPLRDRMLTASAGICGVNCSWDQWSVFYRNLTQLSIGGPEAYVSVSPSLRARTIPVDAYVDCVTRSQCAVVAQLYMAGAPAPTTTTTTSAGGGSPTTTTTQGAASLRDRIYTASGNNRGLSWDQWGFYYKQVTGNEPPIPDDFFNVDNVKRVNCANSVGGGCLTVDEWYTCTFAAVQDCTAVRAKIGQ